MATTTVKRTTMTTTTMIRPKKKKIEPTATEPEPEPVKEPMEEPAPPAPAPEPTSSYCDTALFTQQQIKRRLVIPFYRIKQHVDVKQLLVKELANQLEGRCSIEGYIIPNSIVAVSPLSNPFEIVSKTTIQNICIFEHATNRH